MAKVFSLEGLLRLRRLQQDQAAAEVSVARSRAAETVRRKRATHETLSSTSLAVTTPENIHSIAAARASSASMLADLNALEHEQETRVELARVAHGAARARALGLEKLETKFDLAASIASARSEQIVLDEISSRAWHLTHGEVSP
jgi:flagellar FliJ protein